MTKSERKIIEDAIEEIKTLESDCFREIGFLRKHKYEMESMAVEYERGAYTKSWLIISSALDKIK